MRESDLAAPVADYLTTNGYTVRSEVKGCDMTAVKGDELVVVELKRGFTMDLLFQAVARQRFADSVYVAVPAETLGSRYARKRTEAIHLLKRLELGLILVSLGGANTPSAVEIALHPIAEARPARKPRKRRAVLKEIAERSGDYNVAGSRGRALLTAYREQAVFIACLLHHRGPLSPRVLRTLGASPRTPSILNRDVYVWFERIARGVYTVRPRVWESITETWPVVAARCLERLDSSPTLPASK